MATGKLRGLNRIFDALPGKFLSKLAPVFKFFGMGAKFAKAIPVLGWVITIIMALFDGVKGFLNADEITGKISTFGDKMVAALSSILSGFTLGLIDSKTIAKVIEPLNILLFGVLPLLAVLLFVLISAPLLVLLVVVLLLVVLLLVLLVL